MPSGKNKPNLLLTKRITEIFPYFKRSANLHQLFFIINEIGNNFPFFFFLLIIRKIE